MCVNGRVPGVELGATWNVQRIVPGAAVRWHGKSCRGARAVSPPGAWAASPSFEPNPTNTVNVAAIAPTQNHGEPCLTMHLLLTDRVSPPPTCPATAAPAPGGAAIPVWTNGRLFTLRACNRVRPR